MYRDEVIMKLNRVKETVRQQFGINFGALEYPIGNPVTTAAEIRLRCYSQEPEMSEPVNVPVIVADSYWFGKRSGEYSEVKCDSLLLAIQTDAFWLPVKEQMRRATLEQAQRIADLQAREKTRRKAKAKGMVAVTLTVEAEVPPELADRVTALPPQALSYAVHNLAELVNVWEELIGSGMTTNEALKALALVQGAAALKNQPNQTDSKS